MEKQFSVSLYSLHVRLEDEIENGTHTLQQTKNIGVIF